MEKQAHSKERIQDKYNITTVFLTKFIFGNNFEILKKLGLVDSYTQDPQIMEILSLAENQRLLFILFKNNKYPHEELKKIILELAEVSVSAVFSYELVNDYCVVVLDFPEEFIKDYDKILEGKYSTLSLVFKSRFQPMIEVINENKQVIGKEYTIYYHIFNKTEWLKGKLMDRLGLAEISDNMELWSKPVEKDLIFNIKNIIK
jgi:hypothetical protein